MSRIRPMLAALIVAFASVLLLPASAHAVWTAAGNPIADLPGAGGRSDIFTQAGGTGQTVCSDMRGGLICAWRIDTPNNDSVRVNRLSRTGARQWNGTAGLSAGQGILAVVLSDGARGAWVVWTSIGGLRAQHYDEDGNELLAANGQVIATAASTGVDNGQPVAAVTPSGDLLVAFHITAGATDSIKVQRLDSDGTPELTPNGIVVGVAPSGIANTNVWKIVADSEGGVALWTENSGGAHRLFANRFTSTGVLSWGTDGAAVHNVTAHDVFQADAFWSSTNGLTVAWEHGDGGVVKLFANRLNPSGVGQWGVGGVGLQFDTGMHSGGDFRRLSLVPDGSTGSIIAWVGIDGSADRIRAQRLNVSGAAQWSTPGIILDSGLEPQAQVQMVSDENGGAYIGYRAVVSPSVIMDVAVFHIGPTGGTLWVNESNTGSDIQTSPYLAADGAGGVLEVWQDNRDLATNAHDIFGRHLEFDGSLFVGSIAVTSPNGGETLRSMHPNAITWNSNFGGKVDLEYSINNGAHVAIVSGITDDGSFEWITPALNSAQVKIHVTVTGETVTDASNAFFTVCPTLNASVPYPTAQTVPLDVVRADFNEDGILDLAVPVAAGVTIMRGGGAAGVGNGTFPSVATFATPSAGRSVAVGDFNNDGILDLAVAHATGISILRGLGAAGVGNGTFAAATTLGSMSDCVGIVAADFDNDGILDLAATEEGSDQVAVVIGLGLNGVASGTFSARVLFGVGNGPEGIVASDFNDDGITDLATANFAGGTVSILLGQGANGLGLGTFAPVVSYTATSGARKLAVGDFDDDGIYDLAVAADGSGVGGTILLGNGSATVGNGTFATHADLKLSSVMQDVAVGDFDRDGRADLAFVAGTGSVQIAWGDGVAAVGNGTFTIGASIAVGTSPVALVVDDFDEDNMSDIAVANSGTNTVSVLLAGCGAGISTTLTLTAPNGGQIFTPGTQQTISWSLSNQDLSVDVELSRDGGVNWEPIARSVTGTSMSWLVTYEATTTARVRVINPTLQLRSDASNANFTICATFVATAGITTAATGPKDVVVGDFDEDGILDLVHDLSGGIAFKRGLGAAGVGNGNFAADVTHSAGGDGKNLVTADFNEDGILDIATTRTGGVAVLLGSGAAGVGNGGFGAATLFPAGADPTGIATGDFNEDGRQDLVVSSLSSDSIFVLLGNGSNGVGNGTFAAGTRFAAGDAPARITTGDFNEDGILDLAIASPSAGSPGVQILLGSGAGGKGNGAFVATSRIATASGGTSVATGDFDEDGITDLAISSAFAVSTARGNGAAGVGNGSFAAAVVVQAILSVERVEVSDINRDGRADLVASLTSISPAGSVQIYYGQGSGATGNGSFSAPESYPFGVGLGPIALSDFDEDGEVDAMIGAPTSSQYARLLGGCSSGVLTVTLNDPNGAEEWLVGSQQVISWSKSGLVMAVDVEFSRDGGQNYETIAHDLTANSFVWDVSGPFTQNARVRVRDSVRPNVNDVSTADFLIFETSVGAPPEGLPAAVAFSAPRPNPARGSTSFALALPEAQHVAIELFDMQGRHVRSLVRGQLGAGQHTIAWDGRDDNGVRTAAGMYFVRARAGSFEATRHVVRVE